MLRRFRRCSPRRCIAVLAALAVFGAGIAQAAHFHKHEPAHGNDLHLQCLLCMHADRAAGPPELPAAPRLAPLRSIASVPLTTLCPTGVCAGLYQARGPPTV